MLVFEGGFISGSGELGVLTEMTVKDGAKAQIHLFLSSVSDYLIHQSELQ